MVTIKTKKYEIEACGICMLKRLVLSVLLVIVFLIASSGPISEEGIREKSEKITGIIGKFECEDLLAKSGYHYTFHSRSGHKYQWRTGGMEVMCDDVSGLAGKNFVAYVRYGDRPVEIIVEGESVLTISQHAREIKTFYPYVSLAIFVLVFMWNFPSYLAIREEGK